MAAVGFAGCLLPSYDRALHALRSWLDSWSGVGHVAVGMARQGYDLQLTRYDEKGWRATLVRHLALPRALGSRGRTKWQFAGHGVGQEPPTVLKASLKSSPSERK